MSFRAVFCRGGVSLGPRWSTGSRWNAGAAPATVSERASRARRPDRRTDPLPCGLRGRSPRERKDMHKLPVAGLLGLAALGAKAQQMPPLKTFVATDPVVVTATREIGPYTPTLRDTVVITREDLDDAGAQSLAEVLQRRANIELRALGGPGQPA